MSNGNLEMARSPEKGETGAEGDTSVQTKYGKNSCMIGCSLFPPQKGTRRDIADMKSF